jgi:benzoyl-CoA reductase/2-hydroxyglutaryl-CoA dehydratase subunit BcrC/BadD/HgdB
VIAIYNEHYDLVEQLHAFRRKDPPVIKGSEAFEVEFSSMLMPKDQHNIIMKEYLAQLAHKEPLKSKPIRLYLSGGGIDQFTYQLYHIIEECGGQVVAEDIGVGKSYLHRNIKTDLPPLDAIVEYRLDVHCPHTMGSDFYPHKKDERLEFIKNTLEKNRIDGAIFFVPLYCECRNTEFPKLKEDLKREFDVPALYIDHDYSQGSLDEASTKIEAFIEMIRG